MLLSKETVQRDLATHRHVISETTGIIILRGLKILQLWWKNLAWYGDSSTWDGCWGQEALYVLPTESVSRELYWSGLVSDMVSVINSCSSVGGDSLLVVDEQSLLHPNVQRQLLSIRDAGPDIVYTHSEIIGEADPSFYWLKNNQLNACGTSDYRQH